MKFVIAVVAFVFALGIASAHTQGRGNGQAKKTTVSAPKTKSTQTPKQTAKATTKAGKTETRVAKAETRAAKRTAKAETRAAKAETKAARKSSTTITTTTTAENTVTPTGTKAPKLNPDQLAQLPAGTTVEAASAGFKNWGQFVAATNASRNHGIPFEQLKAAMTGIAPGATVATTAPMSLGQAVQSLKGTTVTPTTPTTTTPTTTTPTTTTTAATLP